MFEYTVMSGCTALLIREHGSQEWVQTLASAHVLPQPITWVQVFQISESGTSEVNLRWSIALIEVSVEFRLKLSISGSTEQSMEAYGVM